jgi:hypothetical protein
VRAYLASVVHDGDRERLIWRPRPDLFVVERVGHAQHLGAWVTRVVIHAIDGEVAPATRFEINPEHFVSLGMVVADNEAKKERVF